LATEADFQLVAEARSGREALAIYRHHQPDVTLMDLRLPDISGIEATRQIRQEFPAAKIIALTSYDGDQEIYRALETGVRGYLLKDMVHTEVLRAIRIVHAGKRYIPQEVTDQLDGFFPEVALTPREVDVLRLVAQGLGNKQIADLLGTAVGTVKTQVQSILSKLGAEDRTHAVTLAFRRGIIHLHSQDFAAPASNT
jgi:DNA-binding NarL/FixJ family response regulator